MDARCDDTYSTFGALLCLWPGSKIKHVFFSYPYGIYTTIAKTWPEIATSPYPGLASASEKPIKLEQTN